MTTQCELAELQVSWAGWGRCNAPDSVFHLNITEQSLFLFHILFFRNIIELYHQIIIFILYSSITQLPVQMVNVVIFYIADLDFLRTALCSCFYWILCDVLYCAFCFWLWVGHCSCSWLCTVLSPWLLTKGRAKLSLKTEPSMSLMSLCCSNSVLLYTLC